MNIYDCFNFFSKRDLRASRVHKPIESDGPLKDERERQRCIDDDCNRSAFVCEAGSDRRKMDASGTLGFTIGYACYVRASAFRFARIVSRLALKIRIFL